jgi:hypothetical protein
MFQSIWPSYKGGSQHDQKSLLQLSWHIFTICAQILNTYQENYKSDSWSCWLCPSDDGQTDQNTDCKYVTRQL